MSASTFLPVSLPAAVRQGVVAIWGVLPRALLAGAIGVVSLAPLVVAVAGGAPGWILALTTLPPALAATALAGFAASALRHEGLTAPTFVRVDPVLAIVLGGGAAAAGVLLSAPGPARIGGAVVAALLLLVVLPALGYGAVRGRSGFASLRGGVILALARPGWALGLSGLAVLAGFAVAASAGVLALVAGPMLLGVAVAATRALLDAIDELQGGAA